MLTVGSEKKRRNWRWLSALGFITLLAPLACGDDDPEPDNENTAGKSSSGGKTGAGGKTSGSDTGAKSGSGGEGADGAGASTGEGGAGGTSVPSNPERWLVGAWSFTEETYTGYLAVVDDITRTSSFELGSAVEFAGDMVYTSPGGGVVYVGQGESSTIEKWAVNESGQLQKVDDLGLSAFGVTNTLGKGRNVIQIVDDDTAYYFDRENLQVIVFNPATMRTTGETISFAGLVETDQWLEQNFIHRDGDRFIITGRYWGPDDSTTSLVRAAVIDSSDGSVTYAEDTRCGNIAFHATDADGNLYFGSHPGHAASTAAGLNGATPPPACLLRINKGESAFDQSYFVDMDAVSGGIVGGLLQGPDGHAYVFQYGGEGITAENINGELKGPAWEVHSLELGNEEATYAPVEGLGELVTAYGDTFETVVGGETKRFLVTVAADFGSGNYFEVLSPSEVEEGMAFPGFPGPAIAVD